MRDAKRSQPLLHNHSHLPNRFAVIPTPDKLGADPRYTGFGIRIAFLDSGFYPHQDIADRVVAFHDIHGEDRALADVSAPKAHHWHGTQTVVSCAGNGSLSSGYYKGVAHQAELVLVKVSRSGRIDDSSIVAGLRWIIENRERYSIRVLNISLGGDVDDPTPESQINLLCEELVDAGVVITVAAGNSEDSCTLPPASSPSAITVGGYSDGNQLTAKSLDLYHSSFGRTQDGNVKPEVIAPAMFVAAPILPGTPDYDAAQTLSLLAEAPDFKLRDLLSDHWGEAGLDAGTADLDADDARRVIEHELHRRKLISAHYQHVDGTSFAAPITASVVARMLEANPRLSPTAVKNILITTAERIEFERPIRQGYGVIDARRAIELSVSERHSLDSRTYTAPIRDGLSVMFTFHDDRAASVSLVGDHNDWDATRHPLTREPSGLWSIRVDLPEHTRLRYKFMIDGVRWTEDPSHGMKEDDGFGGFHSLLQI